MTTIELIKRKDLLTSELLRTRVKDEHLDFLLSEKVKDLELECGLSRLPPHDLKRWAVLKPELSPRGQAEFLLILRHMTISLESFLRSVKPENPQCLLAVLLIGRAALNGGRWNASPESLNW